MKVRHAVCAITCLLSLMCNAFADSPAREVVPSEESQAVALKVIREIYKADYDLADSPAKLRELAQKILSDGLATQDNSSSCYVALTVSRDIAIEAGDVSIAFQAIDAIKERFNVNSFEMEVEGLARLFQETKSPSNHTSLALKCLDIIEHAVQEDQFNAAMDLFPVAYAAARKSKEVATQEQIRNAEVVVKRLKQEFDALREPLSILRQNPTHPDSNLIVGKYYCFSKQQWERGIPLLALGSDKQLQTLGLLELADSPDFLAIGDSWWDYSETVENEHQKAIRAHVAGCYKKALPNVSGVNKAKLEKRLTSIEGDGSKEEQLPVLSWKQALRANLSPLHSQVIRRQEQLRTMKEPEASVVIKDNTVSNTDDRPVFLVSKEFPNPPTVIKLSLKCSGKLCAFGLQSGPKSPSFYFSRNGIGVSNLIPGSFYNNISGRFTVNRMVEVVVRMSESETILEVEGRTFKLPAIRPCHLMTCELHNSILQDVCYETSK